MFISRELNRCLAAKQVLLQESESNRDLIRSETLRIRQQTEGWLGMAAAVAQKVSTIASGIFSFRFVTGMKMLAPLRLLSRAFMMAQTLSTLWPKQQDNPVTIGGITAVSRDQNPDTFCQAAGSSAVADGRTSERS